MTARPWRVVVAGSAERQLARLPEKAAAAIVEAINAIAQNPRGVGKSLKFELEGHMAARRGPYRIINAIDSRRRLVTISAIGHRADVYRRP